MLFDDILKTVNEYGMIKNNDHIILGLSGGADSVCLLHFLCWLKERQGILITAVHVNHGLRQEAGSDEDFAKHLCDSLNIPLEIFCYDINALSKSMKLGIEEAGREMRYKAFAETTEKFYADKIAVAHNAGDNTETVILNLCRGAGMRGMCGIPPVRDKIIRPLIRTERRDIEKYLNDSSIEYITDKTNLEPEYARNKVRLNIAPALDELSGGRLNDVIFRNCSLMSDENLFLEQIAEDAYIKCLDSAVSGKEKTIILNSQRLQALDPVIGRRVIRRALSCVGALSNISFYQSENILSLTRRQTGKTTDLPNGFVAYREYDRIIISQRSSVASYCYKIELNKLYYINEIDKYICASTEKRKNVTNLQMLYTRLFDYDKIKNSLELRTRKEGDVILVEKMGGTKKLKDYFIDNKIPRTQRDREPLLADGSSVIWLIERKLANSDYEITDENGHKILYVSIWRNTDELNNNTDLKKPVGHEDCRDSRRIE